MNLPIYDHIQNHPLYQEIISSRRVLVWPLSLVILISYLSFILALAFFPDFLAQPIGSGVASIGMVFGFALILLTFLLTGIYSYIANKKIEPMLQALRAEFDTDHK